MPSRATLQLSLSDWACSVFQSDAAGGVPDLKIQLAERRERKSWNAHSGLDGVFGDEGGWVAVGWGDARGGYFFTAVDAGSHVQVEGEDLGEEVPVGIEAVGVEDGGVECCVGVSELMFELSRKSSS